MGMFARWAREKTVAGGYFAAVVALISKRPSHLDRLMQMGIKTPADDFIKVPELSWVLDKDVLGIHICWTDEVAEVTVSLH